MLEQLNSGYVTGTNCFTGGYTCPFCGMYITHNNYHACTPSPPYNPTFDCPVTVGGTDIKQDDEITKKLDKIIDLLERISRNQ